MIELVRVVEHQANLCSYRATGDEQRAAQLELLIEITKPKNLYPEWHELIATPFRYSPPHRQARFRPPYGKNIFYGSVVEETALYEHAYHFMKQRLHLPVRTEVGIRTLFQVEANSNNARLVKNEDNHLEIMNKNDYSASHEFVTANPSSPLIIYPSCRDPLQRDNAAVLDIRCLGRNPGWESSIKFFFDKAKKQITWLDYNLPIQWHQVS